MGIQDFGTGAEIETRHHWEINVIDDAFPFCKEGENSPGCGYSVKSTQNLDEDVQRDIWILKVNADFTYPAANALFGEPYLFEDDWVL